MSTFISPRQFVAQLTDKQSWSPVYDFETISLLGLAWVTANSGGSPSFHVVVEVSNDVIPQGQLLGTWSPTNWFVWDAAPTVTGNGSGVWIAPAAQPFILPRWVRVGLASSIGGDGTPGTAGTTTLWLNGKGT